METTATPRLYVGTFHKYNSGSIAGAWIELTNPEEFYSKCREIHSDEEDPEFMFQDYDGFPQCFYSESWITESLWEYLEKIQTLSTEEIEALLVFIKAGYDMEDFVDAYRGKYDSELDFATEFIDECYDLEKMMGNLSYYFDYEKFSRDLFINDYFFSEGYVFARI